MQHLDVTYIYRADLNQHLGVTHRQVTSSNALDSCNSHKSLKQHKFGMNRPAIGREPHKNTDGAIVHEVTMLIVNQACPFLDC